MYRDYEDPRYLKKEVQKLEDICEMFPDSYELHEELMDLKDRLRFAYADEESDIYDQAFN